MERKIRKSVFKYLPWVLLSTFLPALIQLVASAFLARIYSRAEFLKPNYPLIYSLAAVDYFFKLVISVLTMLDLKRNNFPSYWVGLIGMLSVPFALVLVLLTSFTAKKP